MGRVTILGDLVVGVFMVCFLASPIVVWTFVLIEFRNTVAEMKAENDKRENARKAS